MTQIPKLLFGTAGIPLSTPNRDTLNGIEHIKTLGLDSMELEFVRSINISPEKAPLIKAQAKFHNVTLTCHGQYFINLNAQTATTLQQSTQRILDATTRANEAGAWSICYHMAYYMKDPQKKVYDKVKQNLKPIIKHLKDTSNPIWLRPETGGKIAQFADIDDLIRLSQDLEQVLPCIDWAHHYARSLGKTNSLEQFKHILEKIEHGLDKHALQNMHMHMEGIEYTDKGERNHVDVKESPFDYQAVLKALKEFKVKGVLTCESPHIEEDAVLFKKTYEEL